MCKGDGINFTLDESPGQGSIAVRLLIGGLESYCAMTSPATNADVRRDKPAADGKVGIFVAIDGSAPTLCPQP